MTFLMIYSCQGMDALPAKTIILNHTVTVAYNQMSPLSVIGIT